MSMPGEGTPAGEEAPRRAPRRGRGGGDGDRGGRRDNRGGPGRGGEEERDSEFVDKLVAINRVAKVVKGGKNFAFAALVVVGDKKGRVGFGHGKAREVPEAIRKATEEAKKSLIRVPLREGRTLHHDGHGHWGAGKIMLRAAPPGTGLIAGGPMRAVLEVLGVSDVVAKSKGSSNPYNMVRATFDALKGQTSPRQVASRRSLKVSDLVNRRKDGASLGEVPAEG
jgi:small subunit ribosomal protein S5